MTLKENKNATAYYVGVESEGVAKAIIGDANVIDIELSITRGEKKPLEGTEPASVSERAGRGRDRIDIAQLQPTDSGHAVVFWEATHYSNSDLFNGQVLQQLNRYRNQIESNKEIILDSCRAVCGFQARIGKMRREIDPALFDYALIEKLQVLSNPQSNLSIDLQPRIFAFGFDDAQKKSKRWSDTEENLKKKIGLQRVRSIGKPYGGYLSGKRS
jgi:hypothetical protein